MNCQHHHRVLHQSGQASFEQAYQLSLKAEAAKCEAEWQRHLRGSAGPRPTFEQQPHDSTTENP